MEGYSGSAETDGPISDGGWGETGISCSAIPENDKLKITLFRPQTMRMLAFKVPFYSKFNPHTEVISLSISTITLLNGLLLNTAPGPFRKISHKATYLFSESYYSTVTKAEMSAPVTWLVQLQGASAVSFNASFTSFTMYLTSRYYTCGQVS